MTYALLNFRRWLLGGVVCLLAVGSLSAQNSHTVSWNGASATISVSWQHVSGLTYDLTINISLTAVQGQTGVHGAGAAIPLVWGHDISSVGTWTGTHNVRTVVDLEAGTGRPFVTLRAHAGGSGFVDFRCYLDQNLCPDYSYDFTLHGSITGTRYRVMKVPDDGEPEQLADVTLWFNESQRFNGMIPQFCGTVTVFQHFPDQEYDWQEIPPPPTPPSPPPPPNPPPGPNPLPSPPSPPDPPADNRPPDPPKPPNLNPPPNPLPANDGDEGILWDRDTNQVARGIAERQEEQTEYLRQIRDNTDYANDRLEKIDENVQLLADDAKRKEAAEQAAIDADPGIAENINAGNVAAFELAGAMGTVTAGSPDVSSSDPDFTISLPPSLGGVTVDLNPFRSDRFGPMASWIRTLISWLLVIGWMAWAAKVVNEAMNVLMLSPQARGNTVVAGTGAQATAAVAAGLITAIILSAAVTIYAAWRDTTIGGLNLAGALSSTPFGSASGVGSKIVWMLEQILPLTTIIAVLWARVTFRFQVYVAAYLGATLKRFIVP